MLSATILLGTLRVNIYNGLYAELKYKQITFENMFPIFY